MCIKTLAAAIDNTQLKQGTIFFPIKHAVIIFKIICGVQEQHFLRDPS